MGKPEIWKFIIFGGCIIILIYGASLIADIRINEGKYTKTTKFEIPIHTESDELIYSVTGKLIANNGFFTNEPFTVDINAKTNSTIKQLDLLFESDDNHNSHDKLSFIKKYDGVWNVQSTSVTLSSDGKYDLSISGIDTNNKTISLIIKKDVHVLDTLEQIQFEANKQAIKNGIVIEGLSWIVIGATGITFLAQLMRD